VAGGPHQQRRDKLLKALDQDAQSYGDSNQKQRQAFCNNLCDYVRAKRSGVRIKGAESVVLGPEDNPTVKPP
jgi:hypothetical protein